MSTWSSNGSEPETTSAMERGRITRRGALKKGLVAAGGVVVGGTAASGTVTAGGPPWTVMTRNLYLGVNLARTFRADSPTELASIVGQMIFEIQNVRPFSRRAGSIAEEVATHQPDVVGLQEVARFELTPSGGETRVIDYLDVLLGALESVDRQYEAAVTNTNADVTFPVRTVDGPAELRFVDRDVIIARPGTVRKPRKGTYAATREIDLTNENGEVFETIELTRGWTSVEYRGFVLFNTHLELTPAEQLSQAAELLELTGRRPTIVLGDINSDPDDRLTRAYDLLTSGGFTDLYASVTGRHDPTCCYPERLTGSPDALDRQVDVVLARDGPDARWATRVGLTRNVVVPGGVPSPIFPSDHAGVVVSFRDQESGQ